MKRVGRRKVGGMREELCIHKCLPGRLVKSRMRRVGHPTYRGLPTIRAQGGRQRERETEKERERGEGEIERERGEGERERGRESKSESEREKAKERERETGERAILKRVPFDNKQRMIQYYPTRRPGYQLFPTVASWGSRCLSS